jgi:hypothetical protein
VSELRGPWLRPLRFADTDGCAVPTPPPLVGPGVQVWRTPEGDVIACGYRTGNRLWMHWPSLVTYGFAHDDPFITAYLANGASRETVRDIYGRSVLPMALQALGFEAMHASAVVDDRGVVVFAGRSGAGKSTIAFGLSRRGHRQWSDDAVVFQATSHGASVMPLPFTVRLRQPSTALVGAAPAGRKTPPDGLPARILAVCVVSPVEDDGLSVVRRLDPADAFRCLLTHAHEFDPANLERRRLTLEAYLDLAAAVPTYAVMVRHGRDAFEPLLDEIIDAVGLSPAGTSEPAVA